MLALVAALALAGCSFTVRGPDPGRPVHLEPQCDRSAPDKLIPDAAGGTAFALASLLLYAITSSFEYGPACEGCSGHGVSGLWPYELAGAAVSGIYWTSFAVGVRRTRRCRAAYRRYQSWAPAPPPEPR